MECLHSGVCVPITEQTHNVICPRHCHRLSPHLHERSLVAETRFAQCSVLSVSVCVYYVCVSYHRLYKYSLGGDKTSVSSTVLIVFHWIDLPGCPIFKNDIFLMIMIRVCGWLIED